MRCVPGRLTSSASPSGGRCTMCRVRRSDTAHMVEGRRIESGAHGTSRTPLMSGAAADVVLDRLGMRAGRWNGRSRSRR